MRATRRHPARAALGAALAVACVLALGGCEQAPTPAAGPAAVPVVASFYPLWEFARQVGGDRATVTSLVPPGVEPHDWEPSPQDVAAVRKARLFIYNGGGFEPAVDRLLRELGPGTVTVAATAGIEPLDDPHVWLDPVLAQRQVDAIRAALERVDPPGAPRYVENAAAFKAKLAALDEAYRTGLATCARRSLIVSHAAFTSLARRYGLKQIAITGVAPQSEPSPAELARIARLARAENARYVFFETLVSPKLAETIAREIGARTLVLNPLEGLTREEAAAGRDYLGLMRDNLAQLRTGLECR